MDSIRAVAFRPFARSGVIASSLAILAVIMLPNAAFAATTTFGSALTPDVGCFGRLDTVQMSAHTGGPTYTVPAGGGSITAWNTTSAVGSGPAGLQVWRLTAPATPGVLATYTLVGTSSLQTLSAANPGPYPVSPAITVVGGELIGLRLEGQFNCFTSTTDPTDSFGFFISSTPIPAPGTVDPMTVYPLPGLLSVTVTLTTAGGGGGGGAGCDQTGQHTGDYSCDQSGSGNA